MSLRASARSSAVFSRTSMKQALQMRRSVEYAPPNFGIATHSIPAGSSSWQRKHSDMRSTATRFGLPFVPPIKEGVGPLGFALLIVGLRLSHPFYKYLQKFIKVIQYVSELFGGCLRPVFAEALFHFLVHHHQRTDIVILSRKLERPVFVDEIRSGHGKLDVIEQHISQ